MRFDCVLLDAARAPPGGRSALEACTIFWSASGDAPEPIHINYSFTSFFIIFTFFFFFFFENDFVEKNDALFNQQCVCMCVYTFVLFFDSLNLYSSFFFFFFFLCIFQCF
jgi:hypothetical protein